MTSLLANHLWQSTLFAGAAGLLVLALRNNRAQVRYWIWLIASLKFLVPFSAIVALGSYLAPATTAPTAGAGFSDVVTEIGQPFIAPSLSVAAVHPGTNPVPGILLALWLCGFLVVAFHWYARWRRVRATVRAARPVALATGVPVLSSPALLEPGIFGIFRPVLMMPDGIAERLTRQQLNAILAHELCHVRRRDNLFAALHMLVEAIFWFHPLVWWIGAWLVEERERACDEEVLRLGNEPEIYAESILKTCRFYLESPLVCMSGVTGSDLKKRVVRIMTQHVGQRIGFARKILLAGAGTLAIAGPLAFGVITAPAGAQPSHAPTSEPKPKFEVASIKPDKSGGRNISFRIGPGGRIHAINISPKLLIETAYGVKDFQLTGGPKWIDSTRYDIEAKAADSVARNIVKLSQDEQGKQLRLMLQALLSERFKLMLSHTTKELPIYALVVAKHGPKIHPARLESAGPPGMRRRVGFGRGELDLNDASLSTLADGLSRTLGRVVADKTGLKGLYDLTLKWQPERSESHMFQGPPENGHPPMGNPPPPEASGPSIFTAIQEQLGLKLKAEKGPVEVLVIDHVERPSAN
jgi:uncharacterized protein (TIGR03435 family)